MRLKFKRFGNLFVPAHHKPENQSAVSDYLRYWETYLTYSNVYGYTMPLSQLLENVRRLNKREALILLSKINIFVASVGVTNRDLQNHLRKNLFGKQTEQQVLVKQLANRSYVLFFERQILNLMKYILLECSNEVDTNFDDITQRENLGLCLLGISDYLDETKTDQIGVSKSRDKNPALLVKPILKGLFEGDKEHSQYMLARYYLVWVKLTDEVRGLELDVKKKFKEITQLEVDSYIYLGLSILSQWFSLNPSNFSHDKTGINMQIYFKNSLVPKEYRDKMFDLLTLKIDDFEHRYKEELQITTNPAYSFMTFKQKPLLALDDGFVICLSMRFLEQKISSGIYWIIADGLRNDKERRKFFRDFGRL